MGCSNSLVASSAVYAREGAAVQDNKKKLLIENFHDAYVLGDKLGCGAFGQVCACTLRPGLRRQSSQANAVKVLELKGDDVAKEAKLMERARKEAAVWKVVGNHPNCTRLCNTFFSDDFCYMVTERCSLELLPALELMPEVSERSLGKVFLQMLLSISHCHSVNIVHRDIKPGNFLVFGEVVKLTDFGMAVPLPLTGKLSGALGTAPFMSPELLAGSFYDEKVDIWSFGVTVYVLMFGVYPYMPKNLSTKESNKLSMKHAIIDNVDPPSFKPATGQVRSQDAVAFMKALLTRDPEERPSAEEALQMTWMFSTIQGTHMIGGNLPSLRPMLRSAKQLGAVRSHYKRDSKSDLKLDVFRKQQHSHGDSDESAAFPRKRGSESSGSTSTGSSTMRSERFSSKCSTTTCGGSTGSVHI